MARTPGGPSNFGSQISRKPESASQAFVGPTPTQEFRDKPLKVVKSNKSAAARWTNIFRDGLGHKLLKYILNILIL
jgi:hypothetical protein